MRANAGCTCLHILVRLCTSDVLEVRLREFPHFGLHVQNASQVTVCPNSTASWSIDDAVCKQTDFTSSVQQRTCCTGAGTCAVAAGDPGGSDSSKKKIGIIVGSVVGGAAVLAVFALLLILRRRPKAPPRPDKTDEPFPGDEADRAPAEADDFRFRRDEQALGPGFRV